MKFIKMHGAGNDFVITKSQNADFQKAQVELICHRQYGIGCDQFVVMRDVTSNSCVMDIYNADGSKSPACGNATRCVAYLLGAKESVIKTSERKLIAHLEGEYVSVEMGGYKRGEVLNINGYEGTYVDVGNPHFVIFHDDVDSLNLNDIAPGIQLNKAFPNSVNVNFAQVISDNKIKLRVFERGTGETLSCGTGSCASSVVAHISRGLQSKISVKLRGGVIDVSIQDGAMIMSGMVSRVFEGEIQL